MDTAGLAVAAHENALGGVEEEQPDRRAARRLTLVKARAGHRPEPVPTLNGMSNP
jgi:hypothetical protein